MDADGANHRYLTDGRNLVLTPRFNPQTSEVVYMAYKGMTPRVYLQNIDTGKVKVLGDFPGMTFAPRFSPDGKKVVMSFENKGNSEIYTYDLRTKKKKRLTYDLSIDTAPCYSPDGKSIVFESGDFLIFKNQETIHKRSHFTPKYDGNDRWLMRLFGMKNTPKDHLYNQLILRS